MSYGASLDLRKMAALQTQSVPLEVGSNDGGSSILTQLEEGAKQSAQDLVSQNQVGYEGDSQRPWDRAITMKELREASRSWSLAGDAGLLHYLQDFSQRMFSKTHELDKVVDGLTYETKGLDCTVQNVFNDFLMLSNSQFIENRVYDEEISQEEAGGQKEEGGKTEKTREQLEAEVLPRFSKAVALGLEVLDDAFITVEIKPEEESDDEEGDTNIPSSMVADPIIEPKDSYTDRPLPHLIGTAEFFHDETVGLVEVPSDDEGEATKDKGEESESETETEKSEEEEETETETETEGEESSEEEAIGKKKAAIESGSSENESEDEDLFGEKKVAPESESDEEPEAKNDLQAELAAKLGLPATERQSSEVQRGDEGDIQSVSSRQSEPGSVEGDSVSVSSSVISKQSKKRTKSKTKSIDSHSHKHKGSSKRQQKKQTSDEDLFKAPVPDDDLFGEGFGQKGGLFSGGSTLFDDNEEEGDLFGESTDVVVKTSERIEAISAEPTEIKPRSRTTSSGKKIPAGAVSIFGESSGILIKQKSVSEEGKLKEPTTPKKAEKKAPPPIKGLFDDDEEEEGTDSLFQQTQSKSNSLQVEAPIPRKKTLELFDDDEEESDVFGSKTKKSSDKGSSITQTKKIPVGGVSIFGGAVPSVQKEVPKENKVEAEPIKEGGGLFDDDSALFSDAPKIAADKTETPKVIKPKKNVISLFDDDDEDDDDRESADSLFTSAKAPKETSKLSTVKPIASEPTSEIIPQVNKVPSPKPVAKKKNIGLFDDEEEEDLFAAPPVRQKTEKAQSNILERKESDKKDTNAKSLFDADLKGELFGDNKDLIPPYEKPKEASRINQAFTVTVEKAKTKKTSVFEDESDEDLFGSKKISIPVAKDLPPAQTETPKLSTGEALKSAQAEPPKGFEPVVDPVEKSKSSQVTNQGAKEQNVTASTTKSKKVSGLFDDDEDGGLFGTLPSLKKPEVAKIEAQPADVPVFSEAVEKKGSSESPDVDLFSETPRIAAPQISKRKKPAGAVSLFGGIDPFAEKAKHTPDKDTLDRGDVHDQDEAGGHKASVSQSVAIAPELDVRGTEAKEVSTSMGRSVGHLQKSLNFNPAALLPGAAPPARKQGPVEANFDKPPEFKTLENVSKDRARIQTKRRLPSRKVRQVAAQSSAEELFPPSEPSSTSISNTSSPLNAISSELIFGPPSFSDSNSFHAGTDSPRGTVKSTHDVSTLPGQQDKLAAKPMKNHDIFANDTEDDIFNTLPTAKTEVSSQKVTKTDAARNSQDFPTMFPADRKDDTSRKKLVESSDEDLFSPKKESLASSEGIQKISDTLSGKEKEETDSGKASPSASEESPSGTVKKPKKVEQKKSPKKSVKKWDDNDLFGNSGSIFDDVPAKSKKKKEKKQEPAKDLFADDDIFASPKSPSERKPKATKASTKKKTEKASEPTKSIFDESAPSIFDDPLNALGGE